MITRNLRTIVLGTVLVVALAMSALPVLASDQNTSISDTAPAAGNSDSSASSGGSRSLIKWLVGGAVVIAVGGYFYFVKNKKKGLKPRNPAQPDNNPDTPA